MSKPANATISYRSEVSSSRLSSAEFLGKLHARYAKAVFSFLSLLTLSLSLLLLGVSPWFLVTVSCLCSLPKSFSLFLQTKGFPFVCLVQAAFLRESLETLGHLSVYCLLETSESHTGCYNHSYTIRDSHKNYSVGFHPYGLPAVSCLGFGQKPWQPNDVLVVRNASCPFVD